MTWFYTSVAFKVLFMWNRLLALVETFFKGMSTETHTPLGNFTKNI